MESPKYSNQKAGDDVSRVEDPDLSHASISRFPGEPPSPPPRSKGDDGSQARFPVLPPGDPPRAKRCPFPV